MFIIYRTIHSNTGLAFMALRDSEISPPRGVNRFGEHLKVLPCSFLTGLKTIGFYVHSLGYLTHHVGNRPLPAQASLRQLGGIGTFISLSWGAAVIVFGMNFTACRHTPPKSARSAHLLTIYLLPRWHRKLVPQIKYS
jgi:hypothetical protein